MARITVLGGTGYAGGHIVQEAAARGHQVTSVSRSLPDQPVAGVTYRQADALDPAYATAAVADADVVIEALSPRGALTGRIGEVIGELAVAAQAAGVRLGVIGGAGSLHVAPGGPRLFDTPEFPAEYKPESLELGAVLDELRESPEALDWFYVSPAAGFGAYAPGERTGTFRLGDDVLLTDDEGRSDLSGADLAVAILDEVENPTHRRARFTAAY
ncbi:MAG: NAD-dependent epimerase [Microbacterium sp. 14-71-5]|jgi:putative NADH-flavin reductase|nr:MAG: NAD-dependent epimerase [Microbacterium sp. 14-71-5]